jgi:hypothetical protein
MTPQEQNEAMLNRLWAEGEKLIQHEGTTIEDLDRLVERVCGPVPEKVQPITGGEWFRFLNEGRPDEYDADEEAENED